MTSCNYLQINYPITCWKSCDYKQEIERLLLAFTPVGETEVDRMRVCHRPVALGRRLDVLTCVYHLPFSDGKQEGCFFMSSLSEFIRKVLQTIPPNRPSAGNRAEQPAWRVSLRRVVTMGGKAILWLLKRKQNYNMPAALYRIPKD